MGLQRTKWRERGLVLGLAPHLGETGGSINRTARLGLLDLEETGPANRIIKEEKEMRSHPKRSHRMTTRGGGTWNHSSTVVQKKIIEGRGGWAGPPPIKLAGPKPDKKLLSD